jgi:mitochondrial fission protein ELM1
MAEAIRTIVAQGFSVMATPSRRTPPELLEAVRVGLGGARGFVWDGLGENPYLALLALADAVLVTGDSANMVSEATATGSPVHIFEPSGGESKKRAGTIDALVRIGAARRFEGRIERFTYEPIDSSGVIAREIARRFLASRATAA